MVTRVTCVLAVGNLYQLTPVGQSPIYVSPHTAHTIDDFAPNGWEDNKLHELTEILWQKMYILLQVSMKSEKQYQKKYQKKIECYKDVNEKLMKIMTVTQKM